jgi:hypothetical protein
MHLARPGRIRETDRGSPTRQERDQSRGDGKGYDKCKEKLHGIPTEFRETNGDSRQFSEMSHRADGAATMSYSSSNVIQMNYARTSAGLPASTT